MPGLKKRCSHGQFAVLEPRGTRRATKVSSKIRAGGGEEEKPGKRSRNCEMFETDETSRKKASDTKEKVPSVTGAWRWRWEYQKQREWGAGTSRQEAGRVP